MQSTPIEYETTIFTLKADDIGQNRATLLHARSDKNNGHFYKAILYIHGYVDYYFQDHVCQHFLDHGYDFYALDLRKCGRSFISPDHDQYRHYCTDLSEYDEEITLSIEHIIQQAKNKERKILLLGHSTGGLISTLYAFSGPRHADIDGIILNSPYLSVTNATTIETMVLRTAMIFTKTVTINSGWYGRSLHVSHGGEWNFDTDKKLIYKVPIHGPFIYAVDRVQKEIVRDRIKVKCPVLCLCPSRSMRSETAWRDEYYTADLVLDAKAMKHAAGLIGSNVTIHEIENGIHDIFLSKQPVREKAFDLVFQWLENLEGDWMTNTTN